MIDVSESDIILSVRNLSAGYGRQKVLRHVSFDVRRGEVLLITGHNGSGKSTLLKSILALVQRYGDSEVVFRPVPDGRVFNVSTVSDGLANGLVYLPQSRSVFHDLTVAENLQFARNRAGTDSKETLDGALGAFPGLAPLLEHTADRLSGGEQQMLALAMTMQLRPTLLLLDEPLSGLDRTSVNHLGRILAYLNHGLGVTIVVAEHRYQELQPKPSRSLRLYLGHLTDQTAVD